MTEPVLICGGGIGGLSAAIAFARAGIPVRVLEQAASFSEAGAGIELGPHATHHLKAWGLEDLISSFSNEPEGMRIYDGLSGDVLTSIPLGEVVRERYGARNLVIHRKHLQNCLLDSASHLDGIEIETGFELTQFDAQPDGVIATSKARSTARGRALIGADGMWSTVRKRFSDVEPHPAGVTAWRALLPASKAPDMANAPYIVLWLGPGGHVVHYPIDGGASISMVCHDRGNLQF